MKYFTSLNMKSGVDFILTRHLSQSSHISNAQQLSVTHSYLIGLRGSGVQLWEPRAQPSNVTDILQSPNPGGQVLSAAFKT